MKMSPELQALLGYKKYSMVKARKRQIDQFVKSVDESEILSIIQMAFLSEYSEEDKIVVSLAIQRFDKRYGTSFYKKNLDKLLEFAVKENNFPLLIYLRNISFSSNIIRAQEKGVDFFNGIDSRRYQEAIRNSFSIKRDNLSVGGNKKCAFVIGKPFPSNTNTHYNSFVSKIKYLSDNELVDPYFAVTSELSIKLPENCVGFNTGKNIEKNVSWWQRDVGKNIESIFVGDDDLINKYTVFQAFETWLNANQIDKVFFIGGVYESKLFRWLSYGSKKIAVMPTNSNINHTLGKPDKFIDLYFTINSAHEAALLSSGFSENQLVQYQSEPDYHQKAGEFNFSELPLPKSSKRIVTVNSHNRIKKFFSSLSHCDVQSIKCLIEKNNFVWLFVGQEYNEAWFPNELSGLLDRNIFFFGYVQELSSLLMGVDAFFQIPVHGGGGAAIMALQSKTPVILPDFNDAARFVPDAYKYHNLSTGVSVLQELLDGGRERYLSALYVLNKEFSPSDYSARIFDALNG